MVNQLSDTPFTKVGEKEEGDVLGLNGEAMVLKTVDEKGAAEEFAFWRVK
jgi:hypothetical protein